MLGLLGLEYETKSIDLIAEEQKSQEFLELNPLGQVPVLVDRQLVIRDSQAILVYLARCYGNEDWFPLEPEPMAKVVQWLSTAAHEIQDSLSAARRHHIFNLETDLGLAQQKAHRVLEFMNTLLEQHIWLALEHLTIADIACYPYVVLAPEGEITLEVYPHVLAWINRIKELPGYVSMPGL